MNLDRVKGGAHNPYRAQKTSAREQLQNAALKWELNAVQDKYALKNLDRDLEFGYLEKMVGEQRKGLGPEGLFGAGDSGYRTQRTSSSVAMSAVDQQHNGYQNFASLFTPRATPHLLAHAQNLVPELAGDFLKGLGSDEGKDFNIYHGAWVNFLIDLN